MATSIQVNKKSILELLKTGAKNKFIIPEYQRNYSWDEDKCQTLRDDIVGFSEQQKEDNYFLGTIVSYQNEQGEQEIIDGQQRITTLFLLLRAIHKKLESMNDNEQVQRLIHKISPCIWNIEGIPPKVNDYSKIHIKSNVVTDEDNQTFADILETGIIKEESKDNYSINYIFFQECIDEYCKVNALNFYHLCEKILDNCILLPIECDNEETALTIFSTLNDRGMPLSDADIFKAKIYNFLNTKEKKEQFIEQWQELNTATKNANIKMQDLFYYYMFYLRAKEGDKNTTTPGLRNYYKRINFKPLYENQLMGCLIQIADLWTIINNREENTERSKEIRIKQAFSCLQHYPNEFWKYPTTIFYLEYNQKEDFSEIFANFLENLLSVLCASYVVEPTVNAIKNKVLNLNLDILSTQQPRFFMDKDKMGEFKSKLIIPHRNIVRMLLEIYAYKKQTELLPLKWEIEHILPKKRQDKNLYGYDRKEVENVLEQIGNKVSFEKKLNIEAGNNYFGLKKTEYYSKSSITIVKELASLDQSERTPKDIEERTQDMISNIVEWFESRRVFGGENHIVIPSEEDLRKIQKGENDFVEFKSSMRRSYKAKQIDKNLEHEIIIALSAFLNTKGGSLFIGVDDDGNILGLEKDFDSFGKGSDGFLLQIDNLIKTCLGADKHSYIKQISLKRLDDKDIVVIEVNKSDKPIYTKYNGKEEFYIRTAAGSQSLGISATMEYINNHWKS